MTLGFEVSAIFLAIIHYLATFTGLRLRQITSWASFVSRSDVIAAGFDYM
jgi:hypothetical protein